MHGSARTPGDRLLASRRSERLAERDVVAVRVLDAELAETVRRVVDRVVDPRSALLHLGVDRVGVVDPDVGVPDVRTIFQFGHDPLGLPAEARSRIVASSRSGGHEVRRVAVRPRTRSRAGRGSTRATARGRRRAEPARCPSASAPSMLSRLAAGSRSAKTRSTSSSSGPGVVDELAGRGPRALDQVAVGPQPREAQVGEPGLARPEQLALAAQLEVDLGELEAVGRRARAPRGARAASRSAPRRARDEQAVRLLAPRARRGRAAGAAGRGRSGRPPGRS